MAVTLPSVCLIISYILDWVVIIAIAAIGGGLNYVKPYHRPFSLLNLEISYPYIPELVSTTTLVVVSLVAPALIILLVVLICVPGPAYSRSHRAALWRLKLWEFEKGWAGLALSLATAFFITQGMKNLFGKPRPDLLARCQPDLTNIVAHVVGGYGQDISSRWTLVDSGICTNTNAAVLNDGFRSFPSGHSSFSWSGLLYLSFFLCSKFNIAIPHLPFSSPNSLSSEDNKPHDHELLPLHHSRDGTDDSGIKRSDEELVLPNIAGRAQRETAARPISIRNEAASPPNYLIIPAFLPVAVAIYICSSRYAQYYHHGFDILFGSFIGILTAWASFRWYHLPLSRGQGWAWGSRSKGRAFGIGVGTSGYVGPEGWERAVAGRENDIGGRA